MAQRLVITPVTEQTLPRVLSRPLATDHKYSRGVLGMATGSDAFPGAAVLGVTAALSVGVGMVRYIGPPDVATLVLASRPEVVAGDGPADAVVAGSGWPETTREECLERLGALAGTAIPAVLDAGAMSCRDMFMGPAILTPHQGELRRLAETFAAPAATPEEQAAWIADRLDAIVVLKGHETLVVSPNGRASRLPPAPTWLATAGTGDVLAGVMGAVALSAVTHPTDKALTLSALHDAAVVAAFIHQEAARLASATSAGDAAFLASELPHAIRQVVAGLLAA